MTQTDDKAKMIQNGLRGIRWAEMHMKVLDGLKKEFLQTQPFKGTTIGICLHIEPKTAVMCRTLQAGGAAIVATGSPGTTNDDVAAAMNAEGIVVYGSKSDDKAQHERNIESVLSHRPNLILDNGADLTFGVMKAGLPHTFVGCTEETTTGANRLREDFAGEIDFPIIVINDSPLKQVMENEHGVGQTIVEGFMHTTNLLLPGRKFVIIGYGACGRGIARYLRGMGSQVTVVENNPITALNAALDGFKVARLEDTLSYGQVFITVTGRPGIIREEHLLNMQDGVILANAGHFSWEIDHEALLRNTVQTTAVTPQIDEYELADGKRIILLTKGEMLNLAGSKGNPIETMDLGLTLQVSSLLYLQQNYSRMSSGPQPVPHTVNESVASSMLELLSK